MGAPITTLWELPVASAALLDGVQLEMCPGRRYSLVLMWEAADGRTASGRIDFRDVEAVRVTHLYSLTREMTDSAYDRLVEIGGSDWLARSMEVRLRPPGTELHHLRICFDDGPCYEFLCTRFDVTVTVS